jgi:hypothetical protein
MAIASGALRPRSLLDAAAVVGAVLVAALAFAAGQYAILAGVAAAGVVMWLTYYRPTFGIVPLIFLSTDGMKFFSLENLPYVQLAPGLRLNSEDLALFMLLVVGVIHLARRRERPQFLTHLLLLGAAAGISMIVGLAAGTIDVGVGFNGLRVFSGYLFYVALTGVIDTPQKLKALIRVVFALVIVSVVIQIVEAGLQERLTTPWSSTSEYFSATQYVSNIEGTIPYLWNRAVGYLLVGLFLALGGWLWSKKPAHAVIATIALTGFVVALVRQWYIFISIGIVLLVMVGGQRRSGALIRTVLGGLLLFAVVVSASMWLPSGFPLAEALQDRSATILNFQQDYSVIARLGVWHNQIETFLRSPIVGMGPGTADTLFYSGATGWSQDIGMTNSLVQFGALGMAAILFLFAGVLRKARALMRDMPPSSGREYAAAAFSVWVCIFVAYFFTQDFFTSTELAFAVGLVMAIIDRLHVFSTGTTSVRSPA